MWAEYLKIENIRCFENVSIDFKKTREEPCRWITFLGENGGGKSTALQALGLLLAGPEGAKTLVPRPDGWLREEHTKGIISTKLHQSNNDPGVWSGEKRTWKAFGYTLHLTGNQKITINKKDFTEPSIQAATGATMGWLRQNAFLPKGIGWFAVGYGAFRRLTRVSEIITPSLHPSIRYSNFATQFNEDNPLSAFERWMVYLDYRIAKAKDPDASRKKQLGIAAINEVLPDGVEFDSVTYEGRILFDIGGQKVPTIALSDGYRSVLALVGDLIWRLIQAFPDSDDPLKEEGVVLIDELDIHLHPIWQRDIAGWLQNQFPKLQFIVATHSPFIAAGAGEDALTYKFNLTEGKVVVEKVENIYGLNVNDILKSLAFDLISTHSPQTQKKIERYDDLGRKGDQRTEEEEEEFGQQSLFMRKARPFGGPSEPGSLEERMEKYIDENLQ
ncbi:MAG: AAA family ATPase [Candidatus Electryoneaceae bacterium]|nr:AAA family ATPase [Candidatus Electryoneaceae bacterium]